MHLDRVTFRTHRRLEGLYTIEYEPNTLTSQSYRVLTTPPGTRFTAPFHVILPHHRATVYVCVYIYITRITVDILISASMMPYIEPTHFLYQLYDTSSVISIGSFTLVTVSGFIQFTVFDRI